MSEAKLGGQIERLWEAMGGHGRSCGRPCEAVRG